MTLRAFEYEIGPEPMAEFCCSVDFGPQRPPMELLCTAPTAEDVPKLVFASICIVGLILFFTIKKIWEFYIFPNSHNMGAKFLSYTLDDPLSVSKGIKLINLAFIFFINTYEIIS